MRRLNEKDSNQWNKKWLKAFARPVYKAKGTWIVNKFRWHAFSSELVEACSREEAERLFNQQQENPLIGITDGIDELEVFETTKDEVLQSRPDDLIVFPKDLLWTMAFTHEAPWLGHYFSWNPKPEKILDKRRQIQRAKEKGWM